MKTSYIAAALFLSLQNVPAQPFIPVPLDTNIYWFDECSRPYMLGGGHYETYGGSAVRSVEKDTLIGLHTYKKLAPVDFSCDPGFSPYLLNMIGYVRQDSTARYVYVLDELFQEHLQYDFGAQAGDTIQLYDVFTHADINVAIVSVDNIVLNDQTIHRRMQFETMYSKGYIIEGLGGDRGFLFPFSYVFEFFSRLTCVGHLENTNSLYGDQKCALDVGVGDLQPRPVARIYPIPFFRPAFCNLRPIGEFGFGD